MPLEMLNLLNHLFFFGLGLCPVFIPFHCIVSTSIMSTKLGVFRVKCLTGFPYICVLHLKELERVGYCTRVHMYPPLLTPVFYEIIYAEKVIKTHYSDM